MNKKKLFLMLGIFTLIALLFACEGIVYIDRDVNVYESNVTGRAVNAQATSSDNWWLSGTESLSGANIEFYQEFSSGFSTNAMHKITLDSSGTFTLSDVKQGRYKITGSKEGWTFVPRYVDISGKDMTIPDLIAYRSVSDKVLIFVSWENSSIDVEGILTYDSNPVNSNIDRAKIDIDNTSYGENIKLDRYVGTSDDKNIPRVETISISSSFPRSDEAVAWDDTAFSPNTIPENQLRYYVKASGGLTGEDTSSASAYAQVDVMYNNVHCGMWELPYNTAETILHVVTIDALGGGGFSIYSAGNANYGIKGNQDNTGFVLVNSIR